MDVSMEIDDANADKTKDILKEYLKGKINEIKLLSSANDIKKCHVNCLEILQKSEHFETTGLNISNTWQRVHNKKLIIGICVENTEHRLNKYMVGERLPILLTNDIIYKNFCDNCQSELTILFNTLRKYSKQL